MSFLEIVGILLFAALFGIPAALLLLSILDDL